MTKKKTEKKMFKKELPITTINIDSRKVRVDLAEQFVCGGVEDHFQYECLLRTRGLTTEGFVTEVKAFIDAVEREYNPRHGMRVASCEQLAGGVVNVAHKLMGARLVECSVVVFNLTGSVEVSWVKGEKVPEFPKEATREQRKVRPQAARPSAC